MGTSMSDEREGNHEGMFHICSIESCPKPQGLRFIGQTIFRDMTAPITPHGLSMEPAHWILSQNPD